MAVIEADPTADVFQAAAIATLELDPAQGETVINGAKIGTLSLVLRSIADYAVAVDDTPQKQTNRAIRLIRAGRDTDVMATRPTGAEQTADVSTAGLAPPTVAVSEGVLN